jgi:transcriptional regulator with XRE-family HTH domain
MRELAKRVGANIRRIRLSHDFTQEQVAELLGMPVELYGRMERGYLLPRVVMLVGLCRALSTTPDELLGFADLTPDLVGGIPPRTLRSPRWSTRGGSER